MEKKYKDMCSPKMGTVIIEKILPNKEYFILLENWGSFSNPDYGFAIRRVKPTHYGPGYLLRTSTEIKIWKTYKGVKEWIKKNKFLFK